MSHPKCYWLYGERLGIKELAGCIGLQSWEFRIEFGSELMAFA